MARSRVAPNKTISIPRLELCAALAGSQLAYFLQRELTLSINDVMFWSDSTSVLTWICSDTCRYNVLVANRITEILEHTQPEQWRYVDTANNDITRGKKLIELTNTSRWFSGPSFLYLPTDQWPKSPVFPSNEAVLELRKSLFCGHVQQSDSLLKSDYSQCSTWTALLDAIAESIQLDSTKPQHVQAELHLLCQAQKEDFSEEGHFGHFEVAYILQSRLAELAPEYDPATGLIRVGGRLRQSEDLEPDVIHPIVLDPKNHITSLIISEIDSSLRHPGPQRVFAHLRWKYWVLRGRQAGSANV